MLEIQNEEAALEHFNSIDSDLHLQLSARAALFALSGCSMTSDNAFSTLALWSFRSVLMSWAVLVAKPKDLAWLERTATLVAKRTYASAAASAKAMGYSGAIPAVSAFSSGLAASQAAKALSETRNERAYAARAISAWSATAGVSFAKGYKALVDAERLSDFGAPEWTLETAPSHLEITHRDFIDTISDPDGPWRWWRQWYEQMWHGTFTDWEFALEVAKIDWDAPEGESVWEKGPAAVAARIEELERGYRQDLLEQTQVLKAQLAADIPDRHGIGGNYPPEPIQVDELPRQVRESLVIWEPISALEAEASSDTPDKGRARKALEQLLAAAKACGIWAAGHGNTVIGAGAKAVGAAGGTALVAWIAGHGAQIAKIIETAKLWIGGFF